MIGVEALTLTFFEYILGLEPVRLSAGNQKRAKEVGNNSESHGAALHLLL
jgi:hypothetical protein